MNVCLDHVLPVDWPTDWKQSRKWTWVLTNALHFPFQPLSCSTSARPSVLLWELTAVQQTPAGPCLSHSLCCCPQAPHCLVGMRDASFTEDHRTSQIGNASHDTDCGSNTAYSLGLKKFFFHLFKVWWIKPVDSPEERALGKSHSWHEHFSQRSSSPIMPLVSALLNPWKFLF